MSTDRELLEMAARAAGIDLQNKPMFGGDAEPGYYAYPSGQSPKWLFWNPLEDDADAFRLLRQVDYGLLVEDGVVKIMNNIGGCVFYVDINGADEMSVIRRAITSAAAAKAWSQP